MILPINIYSDDILRLKAKPLKGIDSRIEELSGIHVRIDA